MSNNDIEKRRLTDEEYEKILNDNTPNRSAQQAMRVSHDAVDGKTPVYLWASDNYSDVEEVCVLSLHPLSDEEAEKALKDAGYELESDGEGG